MPLVSPTEEDLARRPELQRLQRVSPHTPFATRPNGHKGPMNRRRRPLPGDAGAALPARPLQARTAARRSQSFSAQFAPPGSRLREYIDGSSLLVNKSRYLIGWTDIRFVKRAITPVRRGERR